MAVIVNPDTAISYKFYLAQFAAAARSFKVEPISLLVHSADEIQSAIAGLAKSPNSGLIVLPDTFTTDHHGLIVTLAARHRLPVAYQFSQENRHLSSLGKADMQHLAPSKKMSPNLQVRTLLEPHIPALGQNAE